MNTKTLGSLFTLGLSAFAWAVAPVEISLGQSLLVDDFADKDMASSLGPWSVYPDASGKTTVQHSFVSNAGVNGTTNAIRVDYSLDGSDDLGYNPFIEIKVYMATDSLARDMSNCNEMQYEYRGNNTHYFKAIGSINVEDNYHRKEFGARDSWKSVTVHWNDLAQDELEYWGREANVNDVKKNLIGFVWQVQDYDGTEGFLEVTNMRCIHKQAYTVSFYLGDSLLRSDEYVEGDMPSYNGSVYFETPQYGLSLEGWDPDIAAATANASYHAVVDTTIRSYDVEFRDDDDYRLFEQNLQYGAVPSYAGLNPEKLPSVGYTYTFKGWGMRSCGYVEKEYCYDYGDGDSDCYKDEEYECTTEYMATLPPVTGDVVFYPVYDSTVNIYTVKFANYDGTVLSTNQYAFGTPASSIAVPENPTRASAGGVTYTFEGWLPYVSSVRGNTVYVAKYSATDAEDNPVERYTVTFVNGSEILQTGEYEYGELPAYTAETPKKESTLMYVYTFEGWEDQNGWSVESVDEDKIYMALFDEQYRKYWIVFLDDDNSVIDSVQYEYGRELYEYNLDLNFYKDGYEVDHWEPELKRVTGRAVYQVAYRYRVNFVDDEGNYINGEWHLKGEIPDCRYCEPYKIPTKDYTYEFVGWNKEFAPVTDTTTYVAVFVSKPVPAATPVNIAVGGTWVIDDFEDGDQISLQGGAWLAYRDSGSTNTEISNSIVANGNTGHALKVSYNRDCVVYHEDGKVDDYDCDGWLGTGVQLAANDASVDLTQCNVIQYDYRGGTHKFSVESVYGTIRYGKDDEQRTVEVGASDTWKTISLYRSDFWGNRFITDLAYTHATYFVWSDMPGEGTLEIDNVKCLRKPEYVVKFYNGETMMDSAVYAQGEMPEYNGRVSPWNFTDGMGDEHHYYNFAGWTPELAPVTADVVYRANIESEVAKYQICFEGHGIRVNSKYSWYGSGNYWYGGCQYVEYGTIPTPEETPSLEADTYCNNYEFDKWTHYNSDTGTDEEGMVPVSGDVTYNAVFACTDTVYFTVTFLDDNGDTLSFNKYLRGEYADAPSDPYRKSTAMYDYYFTGWTPSYSYYSPVTENRTYTAHFFTTIREYEVVFKNPNGEWLDAADYEYGTLFKNISYEYDEPEMYSYNDDIQYEFKGWSPDLNGEGSVTGNMTFTAQYNKKFAVRFEDENGNTVYVNDEYRLFYPEGTPLSQITLPEPPVRTEYDYENEVDVELEFTGWLPAISENDSLKGPMTFVASYKTLENKYLVVFMNGSSVLYQQEYAVGETPEFPEWYGDLSREETDQYTYTWNREDGWDKPITAVTGATVYNAKFTATLKTYEVVFKNDNGTELKRKSYGYGSVITDAPTESQVLAGRTGEYVYSGEWCVIDTNYDYNYNEATEDWEITAVPYINCEDPGLKPVTKNVAYVPNIRYSVKFLDGDGNVMNANYGYDDDGLYHYGDFPGYCYHNDPRECYGDEIPTKTATAAYTYTWKRTWSPAQDTVRGSVNYVAQFDSTKRRYEIAFLDEDGTELKEPISYEYGTLATDIERPDDPTKASTNTRTYTFAGWSLKTVTGDATYRASYIETVRTYLVKFVDEDGVTVLGSANYEYNTPVTQIAVPEAPEKAGFMFMGWSSAITPVTKEATYRAEYRSVTGNYNVRFVNYDGTVISSETYAFGTPAANVALPEAPERASNEVYTYTFAGWTPAISDVTGDVTYTALFGNQKRTYTVTFKKDDGVVWDTELYYYNEVVERGWGPQKETPECYYDFDKWIRTVGASDTVKGDMEYTAQFSSRCIARTYYAEFYDPIRGRWSENYDLAYGTKVEDLEVLDVRDTTIGNCFYEFTGWSPELADVTENIVYRAQYNEVCGEQYTVTWVNYNGNTLEQKRYSAGDTPNYNGATPVRENTAKYTYSFAGWSPTVVAVTKDTRYTATFDSTIRKYEITFKDPFNHEGFVDSLMTAEYPYGTKATDIDVPELADTTIGLCTYSFDAWDNEIADVTANATYVATYAKLCVDPPPSSSSVVSSSSVKSSSSVASSSSVKSSSSVASSSSVKSSSSVASSSSTKSSSSTASSSSAKSSSSKVVSSSSEKGDAIVAMYDLQKNFKIGFARNMFTVAVHVPSNVRLQVFDMNGQLMETVDEYIAGSKSFSLGHLDRGNYIVRVWNSTAQRTARIVIR